MDSLEVRQLGRRDYRRMRSGRNSAQVDRLARRARGVHNRDVAGVVIADAVGRGAERPLGALAHSNGSSHFSSLASREDRRAFLVGAAVFGGTRGSGVTTGAVMGLAC